MMAGRELPGSRIGGGRTGFAARAARILLLALISCLIGLPALAAEKQPQQDFGERTKKKIIKMLDLYEAGDIAGAKTILEGINLEREKPYGRARILQFLGSFAVQEEQHEKALAYLERAIKENGLPPEEQLRTMFQVGQLQAMMERYDDAIATFENWMKVTPAPTAQSYYMLAVTYYQAGRAKDALEPARKAIEVASEPQESWYRLLLALYLDAEKYDEGIALLDKIILKYPNKTYWTQLAAIYNQRDQMDKSLAVQQLAQYEGYITEDRDLTRMAQMYMVQGLPHRGAEVMKKGLEDGSIKPTKMAYQTYSDTLLQSREWELALDPLAKAAELAEDGSLWVRHAQVYLQLGRWSDARESLNKAFQKGNIPDEGQAHILYGIAAANDKQWDVATSSFNRAAKFPGTADVSVKWLAFVERERLRFASPEEQAKAAEAKARAEAEAAAAGTTTQASASPAGTKVAGDAKPAEQGTRTN